MASRLIFLPVWIAGLFCFLGARGQEVTMPPTRNPRAWVAPNYGAFRLQDTLDLPFEDDFSYTGARPRVALWQYSSVYRNNDMAVRPPSQGFVTFDGLDSAGYPYDGSSLLAVGRADRLQSLPLRLGSYLVQDSLYLSFSYQPAGWCEAPEPVDSFLLEFRTRTGVWQRVWYALGSSIQPFKTVMIPVRDTGFLYDGFVMRWSTHGSLTGLVDVWHMDYVRFGSGRNAGDSLRNDVSPVHTNALYLRPYRSMPLNQLMGDTLRFLNPLHGYDLTNNGVATSVSHQYKVLQNGRSSPWFNSPVLNLPNLGTAQNFGMVYPRFDVPNAMGDSLDLVLEYLAQAPGDVNPANDTMRESIRCWNYLAYDDGTAETGYGINVVAGSVAYKFWLAQPDSLRGVWMYFTQAAANAANELFVLKVWSQVQERGRGSQELYRSSIPYRPVYGDSLGHFVFFGIDPPLPVADSFYVGWQQETSGLLNIGLDRNDTLVRYNRWYNTQGIWEESSIAGSWMIRPVLGGPFRYPASIASTEPPLSKICYPNPWNPNQEPLIYKGLSPPQQMSLYDLNGRRMGGQIESLDPWEEPSEGLRAWAFRPTGIPSAGLYFLEVRTQDGKVRCFKIIVS
ncbi:MAG: T9SS C-terminal target domain-containing protein [Cytophagia bacterium]|nr:T9SS C-terminal target domain-containing protein [Cytophagia bacterium]